MGLYNFMPRFVDPILRGEKTHTIRARRRYPDRPGSTMHLYTGLRQKGARLLMRRLCVKVQDIEITVGGVTLDGVRLDADEREALARSDGFASWGEMLWFWDGRLPFKGNVFHWSPKCDQPMPRAAGAGHWKEWHRGHGCDLDESRT